MSNLSLKRYVCTTCGKQLVRNDSMRAGRCKECRSDFSLAYDAATAAYSAYIDCLEALYGRAGWLAALYDPTRNQATPALQTTYAAYQAAMATLNPLAREALIPK
jgi:hypothetical protein